MAERRAVSTRDRIASAGEFTKCRPGCLCCERAEVYILMVRAREDAPLARQEARASRFSDAATHFQERFEAFLSGASEVGSDPSWDEVWMEVRGDGFNLNPGRTLRAVHAFNLRFDDGLSFKAVGQRLDPPVCAQIAGLRVAEGAVIVKRARKTHPAAVEAYVTSIGQRWARFYRQDIGLRSRS